MARKRKAIRLGRLRKTVKVTNLIYGLLLQAHEELRWRVFALEEINAGVEAELDKECSMWYD